jgi:metal-responsive CopG/Arc/MetJ family transcriptional regulator
MAPPNPSNQLDKVEFQIPKTEIRELDKIALELSTPENRVTRSDVLREAARAYKHRYREDPDACSPTERGRLRPNGSK